MRIMTNLGLNIMDHNFDDVYNHAFFKNCTDQTRDVPASCAACKHVRTGAGGRITTRYSVDNQFANRTIYCNDLYKRSWVSSTGSKRSAGG